MTPTRFELVAFGESAPPAAVSCDGLVPGAVLHLSHWAGNRTPEAYRRDTSTESALAFAAGPGDASLEVVVNNHLDADGILSCWSLVRPEEAARHAKLIVAAAEAGDFDEWPSDDRGLWLEAAVRRLAEAAGDEARAYPALFTELDALCGSIESRRELWEDEWRRLNDALARARAGRVSVTAAGAVAVYAHAEGEPELPGPALHRLAPAGVTRWLLAFDRGGGAWDYKLDRPRHAWAETVVRQSVPAPSKDALAALGDAWTSGGDELGMTGLARTRRPVREAPETIAARVP